MGGSYSLQAANIVLPRSRPARVNRPRGDIVSNAQRRKLFLPASRRRMGRRHARQIALTSNSTERRLSNASAGRTSGRRPDQGALGSLLHHAARRSRGRGDQGGAPRRRRRHALFCATVSGRSGGLFPLHQPQQEEHHARHEERCRQGGAVAPHRCRRCPGRELSPRRHGPPRPRLRCREGAPSLHGLLLDLGVRGHRHPEGSARLRRHRAG